ncbi:MAG: YceI family protein [Microthrixaceae bacterium]
MRQVAGKLKAHPWWSVAGVAVILVAGGAFLARDLIGVALTEDTPIDYTLPMVVPLEAGPGEVVYRIDANRSKVTVDVTEVLAGVDNDVELTTKGVAGDIGITNNDSATARLSEIAVSVHQLESDNTMRDKILQHEYLESHDHQTVNLVDAEVVEASQEPDSNEASFAVEGDLVVKGESHPVRFEGTAAIEDGELTATLSGDMKMSELGVGPITKVGLVQTSDDIGVTLDLVAVDSRDFTPPVGLSVESVDAVGASADAPSFSGEIQPVLEANCVSCHTTGAVGAQMVTLDDAGDAAEVADGLAVVTRSEYMPPWPPSDEGVPLQHPRGLSGDEIDLIDAWATAGAPLDVPASTALEEPDEPEVKSPDVDISLKMPEPYVGDGTRSNDYRCFIVDPEFTEDSMITGYEFLPDSREVVHHVLVYRLSISQIDSARTRDAADPRPGYHCGDSEGMSTGGSGLVGGWVPGQRPRDFGEGVGLPMKAGEQLVVQIHYHYEGLLRADQSTLNLEIADDPGTVTPLYPHSLVGPVEMPCPAEDRDGPLCDREAALTAAADRAGGGNGAIANFTHRACGTNPEELAARSDGWTATTECTFPVRSETQIVDVLGHMHELGSEFRMTLNKGRPDEKVLLHIPVWNFAWQLNYQPVDPVPAGPGDDITIECSWDRSLRFDPEPRYIFFAEGTEDEMCFATVTELPAKPG